MREVGSPGVGAEACLVRAVEEGVVEFPHVCGGAAAKDGVDDVEGGICEDVFEGPDDLLFVGGVPFFYVALDEDELGLRVLSIEEITKGTNSL